MSKKQQSNQKSLDSVYTKLIKKFGDTNFDLHFVPMVASGQISINNVPHATPCTECERYNRERRYHSPIAE